MINASKLAGQVVFFTLLMAGVGYLSSSPSLQVNSPGETQLKLMVRHSGLVIGACTALSVGELEKLAPNMQAPMSCPREKSALLVKLYLDDALLFDELISPSGIHSDGVIARYQAFNISPGVKRVSITATSNTHVGEVTHSFDDNILVNEDRVVVIQLKDDGFSVRGVGS